MFQNIKEARGATATFEGKPELTCVRFPLKTPQIASKREVKKQTGCRAKGLQRCSLTRRLWRRCAPAGNTRGSTRCGRLCREAPQASHPQPRENRRLRCLAPPAWQPRFLGAVPCAAEPPSHPHGTWPGIGTHRSSSHLLDVLGLLTWVGRAPGHRPPAASGEAARGTGRPAGPPRPRPPREPGHSTASSARRLPHSSRCRPPACTATWGEPESGAYPEQPGTPLVSLHREGPGEALSGGHIGISNERLGTVDRGHSGEPTL